MHFNMYFYSTVLHQRCVRVATAGARLCETVVEQRPTVQGALKRSDPTTTGGG